MNDAQIHAEIAKRVYPDAEIEIETAFRDRLEIGEVVLVDGELFELLDTDSNENPTQQAKASSLDVLVWLVKDITSRKNDHLTNGWRLKKIVPMFWQNSPCAAIFEAAKEVIGE